MDIATPPPVDIKPGIHTTEFSTTSAAAFVQTLIALVVLIHPGFPEDRVTQDLIATVAMSSIAFVTAAYGHGRVKMKQTAIKAAADVQAAALAATTPIAGAHFPETVPGPPTTVGE